MLWDKSTIVSLSHENLMVKLIDVKTLAKEMEKLLVSIYFCNLKPYYRLPTGGGGIRKAEDETYNWIRGSLARRSFCMNKIKLILNTRIYLT